MVYSADFFRLPFSNYYAIQSLSLKWSFAKAPLTLSFSLALFHSPLNVSLSRKQDVHSSIVYFVSICPIFTQIRQLSMLTWLFLCKPLNNKKKHIQTNRMKWLNEKSNSFVHSFVRVEWVLELHQIRFSSCCFL